MFEFEKNDSFIALRKLLKEVGALNLYAKIVESNSKKELKDNVEYAIKSLGDQMPDRAYDELLQEARQTAQNVKQDDVRKNILTLLDALQKNDSVIERMTKAHLNNNKRRPATFSVERPSNVKSQNRKHSKLDFNKITRRALRRIK